MSEPRRSEAARSSSLRRDIFVATLAVSAALVALGSAVSTAVFGSALGRFADGRSKEVNRQLVMNYEGYIKSVIETANYIQFASFKLDIEVDADEVAAVYRANAELKSDVVAAYLFDGDGRLLVGPAIDYALAPGIRYLSWFGAALEADDIYHFDASERRSLAENRDESVIAVSRAVSFSRGARAEEGVLLIELDRRALTDLAARTDLGRDGLLLILDEEGGLLFSSEGAPGRRTDSALALAAGLYMGGLRAVLDGGEAAIDVNTLSHTRWRVVTVADTRELSEARSRLLGVAALVLVVTILASAAAAGLVSLRVAGPVSRLEATMEAIERGDLDVPIEASGQAEIDRLSSSLASMVARMKELMERLVEEQREKRKTELRVLQNQINPHFLYNTLDSIVWLAERGRNRDVVVTVVALARFFRIGISKGETFITVADEIAHIENYLTIQSIRYVDRFRYSIAVDPSLYREKVMKLLLQPIVENAIYHGVGEREMDGEGQGDIAIRCRKEGSLMVFEVSNSGYGLTDEAVRLIYERMRSSGGVSGLGLRNVYQRLKLFYGEEADVSVSCDSDERTTVRLYVPLLPEEEA